MSDVKKSKRPRYPAPVRMRVLELIEQGKSSSSIARETGVNVGVVSRVRHGLYWRKWEPPIGEALSSGKKGRCPQCRCMVWLPCVACAVKEAT